MKKILFLCLVTFMSLNSQMLNGISVIVDNEPITVYDIKQLMGKQHISKDEAVNILIDKILYEKEIKKGNISIDIFDIDEYLSQLAIQNNMELKNFKILLKKQQPNYEEFIDKLKDKITRDKLTKRLVQGKINFATDEDLKIYYNNNSNVFNLPKSIDVVEYVSISKKDLSSIIANPMTRVDTVSINRKNIILNNIDGKIRYLLLNTEEKSFTPILNIGKTYAMLYIIEKKDIQILEFDKVKNKILNIVMQTREKKYLEEYFENIRLSVDIEMIR